MAFIILKCYVEAAIRILRDVCSGRCWIQLCDVGGGCECHGGAGWRKGRDASAKGPFRGGHRPLSSQTGRPPNPMTLRPLGYWRFPELWLKRRPHWFLCPQTHRPQLQPERVSKAHIPSSGSLSRGPPLVPRALIRMVR